MAIEHHKSYKTATITVLVVGLITALTCVAMFLVDQMADADETIYLEVVEEHAVSEPITILLIGSDSRVGTALYTGKADERSQTEQYADILTIVHINPKTYTITLVSVPRDTWHHDQKINASLRNNDPLEVITEVESLTSANIDYYIMTDFLSFEQIIDDIGGVTVDVPITVAVPDPATTEKITVEEGNDQTLDGAEALAFSRARKEYSEHYDISSDALRQVNVRNVEISLIDSVLANKTSLPLALAALNSYTTNNLDMGAIKWIAEDFAANHYAVVYYSATGPYRGYERAADGQWIVPRSLGTWSKLMNAVEEGGDPSTIVSPPTFD